MWLTRLSAERADDDEPRRGLIRAFFSGVVFAARLPSIIPRMRYTLFDGSSRVAHVSLRFFMSAAAASMHVITPPSLL